MKSFVYVMAVMCAILFNTGVANAGVGDQFCGGKQGGNYQDTMTRLSGSFRLGVVNTRGSMDNLALVDQGRCDAGPAQLDAALVYKNTTPSFHDDNVVPVAKIGTEYAHLVCNEYVPQEMGVVGRLMNISDFQSRRAGNYTIAIGQDGSGSNITWRVLMSALPYLDPRNGGPHTDSISDPSSMSTLARVKSRRNGSLDCMFVVSTPKSDILNTMNFNGGNLEFVSINDPAINRVTYRGQPLYGIGYIPPHTYSRLQDSKWAWFNQPVTTLTIDSWLFANNRWYNTNPSYAKWVGDWAKSINYSRY